MNLSTATMATMAVLAPLIGFLLSALAGRILGDRLSQWITCLGMSFSCIVSLYLFYCVALHHSPMTFIWFPWIHVDAFHVNWGIQLDTLSTTMMVVVTLVSTVVHIYSIGYMSQDQSIPRFMGYLSFFTFAMLMLVTAPNLVQLFFGWEGVGVASYLLIGYWYQKPSACAAAMKAFLVNRVGDIGLALGIAGIFLVFKTVDFQVLIPMLASAQSSTLNFCGMSLPTLEIIGILLFIGAMGKSAQFGLHTWLPDAMEGPTPVSALIHAATMVTAGVFLVVRLSALYELAPIARNVICIVGAFTALFAATIALTQNDIKRIIAYSTCSQLGYMFFAAGCSAYDASIFHLVTHAFFKALLFLGAGSVIHAMSDEQDIQKMGGIRKLIPATYTFMWIGSLALAGIPFFSGYFSKDAIIEAAFLKGGLTGNFALSVGLLVALLTAFYSWRLLLLTFHGKPRANDRVMAHVHESPLVMLLPLSLLAVGAVFLGNFAEPLFIGEKAASFWKGAIYLAAHEHPSIPPIMSLLPMLMGLMGVSIAYLFYWGYPALPTQISQLFYKLYKFFYRKWFIDELYEWAFVKRALSLGRFFWVSGDQNTIDRWGPNGVTTLTLKLSEKNRWIQTGYVYHYSFAMLVGLVSIITWFIVFAPAP